MRWALDLGTTNSGLARWDEDLRRPELLNLPSLCRHAESAASELEAPRMIPSAVHHLEADFWTRIGRWPIVRNQFFLGTEAKIGKQALELNLGFPSPAFVSTFKMALSVEPTRVLARVGNQRFSARDVARAFLRELSAAAQKATGVRIRDLTITVPVDSYDTYRAELHAIADTIGITRLRFVDEPVAAAVGYGLGVDRPREVLVFDMGGGTMHAARVALEPRGMEAGRCEVLAKAGRPIGGNVVDRWLLEDFCKRLGFRLPEGVDETEQLWLRMMEAEARRVKESLHFREKDLFYLTAPEELRGLRARMGGDQHLEVSRAEVVQMLEARGLYEAIDASLSAAGGNPEEVLLVGGSTLLPGIHSRFEERFGRDRLRAWQPFESVVLGAAAQAAGQFVQSDLIVHDYAILTHDAKSGEPSYTVIIPRGTRFPTPADFWRRPMVPTCALGEPETVFKLVVYEIGRGAADARRFGWDTSGNLKVLTEGDRVLVPLNASNPAIGSLEPPHPPSDRKPRLDVSFGVNDDRWLVATVKDLRSGKMLMNQSAVVRIL